MLVERVQISEKLDEELLEFRPSGLFTATFQGLGMYIQHIPDTGVEGSQVGGKIAQLLRNTVPAETLPAQSRPRQGKVNNVAVTLGQFNKPRRHHLAQGSQRTFRHERRFSGHTAVLKEAKNLLEGLPLSLPTVGFPIAGRRLEYRSKIISSEVVPLENFPCTETHQEMLQMLCAPIGNNDDGGAGTDLDGPPKDVAAAIARGWNCQQHNIIRCVG